MNNSACKLPAKTLADIQYRPGRRSDSRDIARFICMAGGGLYEFLFDHFLPFLTAVDFLAIGVAADHYPISYSNCRVAVRADDGRVVGAANVFPADLLKPESYALLPGDRRHHIESMLQLQDWGSLFLNALAVDDACRGHGTGARLLAWAEERTKEGGFDRLSLHVWADNEAALDFYRARGFVELSRAAVAPHPRLQHRGGSILMSKRIA